MQFPEATIEHEIRFLEHINRKEDVVGKLWDLVWSVLGFLVFWFVGAALFNSIEVRELVILGHDLTKFVCE